MYKWRDVSVRDKYSLQEYPSFHEKSSSREALLSAVKKSGYVVNNAAASATLNNLVIVSASKTSKLAACVQYLCFDSLVPLGFPMPPNPKLKVWDDRYRCINRTTMTAKNFQITVRPVNRYLSFFLGVPAKFILYLA
uniref:Uncharacterized protein n=1 Tax=Oryza nivara TaxID=4536 RepID=A0A0E0G7C1_ORYNI